MMQQPSPLVENIDKYVIHLFFTHSLIPWKIIDIILYSAHYGIQLTKRQEKVLALSWTQYIGAATDIFHILIIKRD
jgi:hypothetical protein